MLSETMEGNYEVWWTQSHMHDTAAYDPYQQFYQKTILNEDEKCLNSKVSLTKSIAKERGSKHIIIDVTDLKNLDEALHFKYAVTNHF